MAQRRETRQWYDHPLVWAAAPWLGVARRLAPVIGRGVQRVRKAVEEAPRRVAAALSPHPAPARKTDGGAPARRAKTRPVKAAPPAGPSPGLDPQGIPPTLRDLQRRLHLNESEVQDMAATIRRESRVDPNSLTADAETQYFSHPTAWYTARKQGRTLPPVEGRLLLMTDQERARQERRATGAPPDTGATPPGRLTARKARGLPVSREEEELARTYANRMRAEDMVRRVVENPLPDRGGPMGGWLAVRSAIDPEFRARLVVERLAERRLPKDKGLARALRVEEQAVMNGITDDLMRQNASNDWRSDARRGYLGMLEGLASVGSLGLWQPDWGGYKASKTLAEIGVTPLTLAMGGPVKGAGLLLRGTRLGRLAALAGDSARLARAVELAPVLGRSPRLLQALNQAGRLAILPARLAGRVPAPVRDALRYGSRLADRAPAPLRSGLARGASNAGMNAAQEALATWEAQRRGDPNAPAWAEFWENQARQAPVNFLTGVATGMGEKAVEGSRLSPRRQAVLQSLLESSESGVQDIAAQGGINPATLAPALLQGWAGPVLEGIADAQRSRPARADTPAARASSRARTDLSGARASSRARTNEPAPETGGRPVHPDTYTGPYLQRPDLSAARASSRAQTDLSGARASSRARTTEPVAEIGARPAGETPDTDAAPRRVTPRRGPNRDVAMEVLSEKGAFTTVRHPETGKTLRYKTTTLRDVEGADTPGARASSRAQPDLSGARASSRARTNEPAAEIGRRPAGETPDTDAAPPTPRYVTPARRPAQAAPMEVLGESNGLTRVRLPDGSEGRFKTSALREAPAPREGGGMAGVGDRGRRGEMQSGDGPPHSIGGGDVNRAVPVDRRRVAAAEMAVQQLPATGAAPAPSTQARRLLHELEHAYQAGAIDQHTYQTARRRLVEDPGNAGGTRIEPGRDTVGERADRFAQSGSSMAPSPANPPHSASGAAPVRPSPGKPVGAPVSAAVRWPHSSDPHHGTIRHVLQMVDSVHGDGKLPPTFIRSLTLKSDPSGAVTLAYYYPGRVHDNLIMNRAVKDAAPVNSGLHELGHQIDRRGLPGAGYTSEIHDPVIDDLQFKIACSSRYLDLLQYNDNYLLKDAELFARSYAQYIAVKTGDAAALHEIEWLRQHDPLQVWDDADFVPIREAFDELFRRQGWRV